MRIICIEVAAKSFLNPGALWGFTKSNIGIINPKPTKNVRNSAIVAALIGVELSSHVIIFKTGKLPQLYVR